MKSVLVPLKISTISLFNKHVNKETGLFDLQSFNHAVIELQAQQQVKVEPEVKPANGGVMAIIDLMIDEKKEEGLKLSYKRQFNLLADKNAEIIALIQLKSRLSV